MIASIHSLYANTTPLAVLPDWTGKAAFMTVFALLILVLLKLPTSLVEATSPLPPWYRRVRLWAIVIATVQIIVYACWA